MKKLKRYFIPFALGLVLFIANEIPAQNKADSLLKILPSVKGIERCDLLIKIVRNLLFTDAGRALNYAQEALKIAGELKNETKSADCEYEVGYCNYRLGNFALALTSFRITADLFTKKGEKTKSAEAKNMIGLIYTALKRFDVALEMFNELLAFYNELGLQKNYASILINVSNIFLEKKDYDRSLEGYFKVLEINKRINANDKELTAIVYCNIGQAYYEKKQYDLSYKYRKMSLDIYVELKFVDGIANLQMDTGMSVMKLKDFKQARVYLSQALDNYKSIKYAEGIRRTLENFSVLYYETQQYGPALTACVELEGLCIASKDSSALAACYKMFADIYHATNDFKLASEYYSKYVKVKDVIESKENKQRMFELQTAFETEEKEYENKTLRQENELQKEKLKSKENLLLTVTFGVVVALVLLFILIKKEKKIRKINEKIQEQNKILEEHLVSKDKFFSILAHNLKNPFWAVLGQNKMLEDDYDELTEKERKELIVGIGNSAGNVYKLFEDLLKWAKSQQNAIDVDREKVNIRDLIKSSISPYRMLADNKRISIEINVNDEVELTADKFMMETVIGNLVDNAIKFSVQDENVLIKAYRNGEQVEIMVQDYGMGISEEKMEKLFKIDEDISTKGTANEKGTGLGLIICKEFVEKQKGQIKVESSVGKGTTFTVIMPVN